MIYLISFKNSGNFDNLSKFLESMRMKKYLGVLNKFGEQGVSALRSSTPVDTGLTANSWSYNIDIESDHASIYFTNSNIHEGVNIAIILQYGHGTGTGGYVAGRDYINPAMRPIFDEMANAAWKEVQES